MQSDAPLMQATVLNCYFVALAVIKTKSMVTERCSEYFCVSPT